MPAGTQRHKMSEAAGFGQAEEQKAEKKGVRGKSTYQKAHTTSHSCNARVAKIVFSRNINNVSCPKISFFSVETRKSGAPLEEERRL